MTELDQAIKTIDRSAKRLRVIHEEQEQIIHDIATLLKELDEVWA